MRVHTAAAAAAAAFGLAAAGCTSDAETGQEMSYAPANASAEQSDCFNARFVNGFSEVDRDTVRVRVGVNDYYDVHVTGTCMDLDWTNRLALVTRTRSMLCVGNAFGEGELVTEQDRCTITEISHSPRRPAEDELTPYSAPPEG